MDSYFNSNESTNAEKPPLYHDSPEKFSSFGRFNYYEILKKDFQKGFLLDFDYAARNHRRLLLNLKEGFSYGQTPEGPSKVFRKFAVFSGYDEILKVEAKISHFSMESLKFNLNSNFAFFKNLKIYSSLKPYYTKNYPFSKLGIRYLKEGVCIDSRIEFEKTVNVGVKGIYCPNGAFFCGGLARFGTLNREMMNLSLILGIRQPEYEFIFKNETICAKDLRKVGLCVNQNVNEKLSLAALYKYKTKGKSKVESEADKFEFGVLYRDSPNMFFKLKLQNLSILKTSIKILEKDYLELTLCNNIALSKESRNEKLKDLIGIRLKLNLI